MIPWPTETTEYHDVPSEPHPDVDTNLEPEPDVHEQSAPERVIDTPASPDPESEEDYYESSHYSDSPLNEQYQPECEDISE